MLHLSAVDGRAAIPIIQRMPYRDRESIRLGYIPLEPALKDRQKLLDVCEISFGLLQSRPRRGAHVQPDLPRVDGREKVAPHVRKQETRADDEDQRDKLYRQIEETRRELNIGPD